MPDQPHPQQSRQARAPWTAAQAFRIAGYQARDGVHPLTCFYHSAVPLNVSQAKLYCGMPTCSYEQDWVPAQIAGPK